MSSTFSLTISCCLEVGSTFSPRSISILAFSLTDWAVSIFSLVRFSNFFLTTFQVSKFFRPFYWLEIKMAWNLKLSWNWGKSSHCKWHKTINISRFFTNRQGWVIQTFNFKWLTYKNKHFRNGIWHENQWQHFPIFESHRALIELYFYQFYYLFVSN